MIYSLEVITSRGLMAWMSILILSFLLFSNKTYRIGPHSELFLFNVQIDTYYKYWSVVLFCFMNSTMRTLQHQFLQPYIINQIQDTKNIEKRETNCSWMDYEITLVSALYVWVDFFIYMNLFLVQIDFFLFEILADVIVTICLTSYYLQYKNKNNYPEYIPIA